MPDHLKSLVVLLVLSTAYFLTVRKPLCEDAIEPEDFSRRRNLWFGLTLAAFLAHNFWFYVLIAIAMVVVTQVREPNRLAMFLFVLFAVPGVSTPIPGFGLIQQVFPLGHVRLMCLLLLVPAFLALHADPERVRFGRTATDKFLIGYLLLQIAFNIVLNSFTVTLRTTFLLWLDVVVPYYVASRSMRDMRTFKDTMTSFVVASLLMAPIAAFESLKHWLLYASVDEALGLNWDMGTYLSRGESLRATVSTGHALVLSYVMVVTMGLYIFVSSMVRSPGMRILGWLGVVVGLLAPLGRGAWLGAAAGLLVATLLGDRPAQRIAKAAVAIIVIVPVLIVSPWGGAIVDHLPFVGTVDSATVLYRQRLVEVSLSILAQNPMLGVYDYMNNAAMEEMRQGQGIIDMVNSYLGVAMSSGLVGVFLFSGILASSAFGVWRAMRRTPVDSEARVLGRALLAAMTGAAVTIATISFIILIPLIFWMLAGFGVAYAKLVDRLALSEEEPGQPDAGYRGSPAMGTGQTYAPWRSAT
jgi:hypothetical protein